MTRKTGRTIKIGPHVYKVIETPRLQSAGDMRSLCGEIDFRNGEIRIDSDVSSETYRRLTIFHEVIHGILELSGFRDDHDEQMIDAIAGGIVQVLQDNPWLRS